MAVKWLKKTRRHIIFSFRNSENEKRFRETKAKVRRRRDSLPEYENSDIFTSRCHRNTAHSFAEVFPMRSLRALLWFFGLVFLTSGIADSHNGLIDGYGCHRDPKKGNYHCHQGPYAGKSFPSRDEFLRQLRNPKSNLPQPKNTPLPPEQPRPSDMEDRNRP